jgi:hypothetical protein
MQNFYLRLDKLFMMRLRLQDSLCLHKIDLWVTCKEEIALFTSSILLSSVFSPLPFLKRLMRFIISNYLLADPRRTSFPF